MEVNHCESNLVYNTFCTENCIRFLVHSYSFELKLESFEMQPEKTNW
jgi:hypothetical protein